uniref:Transmembrane protein n=1 Tax=Ascaris lumbricoides TaxID=6252 RepID=A0A0M3HUQ9_ASCLU
MAQPSTSGINQETIASNYSVDRVVSQVEQVSGLINDLVISAKQRVDGVAARGQESLAGFAKQFAIGKEEVDHMLSIVEVKTKDFPLVAFYVLLIMMLIIVLTSLLYLLTTGSARVANRYYRMKPPQRPETV